MAKKSNLTCFDVADYFLSLVDEDTGDSVSNLKLQKLAYYAQGFNIAFYNEPLFKERIEAWQHGPVIPDLYDKYKVFDGHPIDKPSKVDFSKYSERDQELLNEIYEHFGQFSAWKLRDMTHQEPPWIRGNKRISKLVTEADMKAYFSTQIDDET